jgi:putative heme-binding domain-containing protein
VEAWVKLAPGIDNSDGLLGAPQVIDMNFADGRFRVWINGFHDVVIAKRRIAPEAWTHVAAVRDAEGRFQIFINGELDAEAQAPKETLPGRFENLRIGWTHSQRGTDGWITEFRIWNRARTADEIRANFDRSFAGESQGMAAYYSGEDWSSLRGGARVARTDDFPELLTLAEAKQQEEQFEVYRRLAQQPGDLANGRKLFTALCMSCHSVGGEGGQVGPVLSGAGAMGAEALLRALLTPNAAMEAGYRTFRIEMTDGEVLDGMLVSQDAAALVLRRPNLEDQRIARDQIRRAEFQRTSLMPGGLLESLEPKDAADLLAYLRTLK